MPGILDVIAPGMNPLQAAQAAAQNGSGYFPPAPAAGDLSASPTLATSRIAGTQPYSPLRDPEGPLARAGWIGALFATGPSRTEYLQQQEDQKERQLGISRAKAFQKLGNFLQEGQTPQKAFLNFLNTPEGMDFVISDPNPGEAVQQFLKISQQDPVAAARASVFGGSPAAPATPGTTVTGQPATTPNQLSGVTQEQLRNGARQLAAIGDTEGANLALRMADQYDALKAGPTTDELKEYDRYVEQEKTAGRDPMSWIEYKLQVSKAASAAPDPQTAARIDVDKDAAKEAAKSAVAAQRAMPVLDEIERLNKTTPGGYKGALLPYLGRVATSFGIEIPEGWGDAEALNAMAMQLIPLVRQPGQVSNYEQQKYLEAIPSLLTTQQGRIKMISALRKQAARAQDIARVFRQNIGSPDLYDKLAELDKPMFTADEIREFEEAAAGKPPSEEQPAQAQPNTGGLVMPDEKQYNEMKAGTLYTKGDGYEYKKGDPKYRRLITTQTPSGGGGGGF